MIANDQDSQVKDGGLLRPQTGTLSVVGQVIVTVSVCVQSLVLVNPSEATRNHQASTKVFATPVLVIASQVSTRLSIILQRKNIDALLTAMNPLVREFLAACAEEIPPVAR